MPAFLTLTFKVTCTVSVLTAILRDQKGSFLLNLEVRKLTLRGQ